MSHDQQLVNRGLDLKERVEREKVEMEKERDLQRVERVGMMTEDPLYEMKGVWSEMEQREEDLDAVL